MAVTAIRRPAAAAPAATPMRVSNTLVILSALIAVLALMATAVALFWQEGSGPFAVTSIRGETVELYGRGIYSFDPLFRATINLGTDSVILLIGIPLLVVTTILYRRGSLHGGLLLIGTLFSFFYVYSSLALGAAYNSLFLVYIALFSASLFAFVLAFTSIDAQRLAAHISDRLPRRGIAIFMIASGLMTTIIWLGPLLGSIISGTTPSRLLTSTTQITDVLDLGIITPATILSGIMILRRNALGYIIAFSLIVLEVMLAPMITAGTLFQLSAGVEFTPGEIIGPICGFVILALFAIWATVSLLRNTSQQKQG